MFEMQKDKVIDKPKTILLYEDHMRFRSAVSNTRYRYSEISGAFENEKACMLKVSNFLLWLEKDAFTKGNYDDFRKFLREYNIRIVDTLKK